MSQETIAKKSLNWVDKRFPVVDLFERHLSKYYSPSNINIWYLFGFLLLIVLVMQIVTGLWLMMNYTNTADEAFASIEYIMRDVQYGWLIRYMHAGGASAFFDTLKPRDQENTELPNPMLLAPNDKVSNGFISKKYS